MTVQRLSHIGICVSDLARSVAFYRDALGFRELSRITASGDDAERITGIPGGLIRAVYLERDGTRIELMIFPDAGVLPGGGPAPLNRLGLTHLSLRVADLDAVLEQVRAAGGAGLDDTRISNPEWGSKAMFITDPDGLRIELLQAPGDPNALPGG